MSRVFISWSEEKSKRIARALHTAIKGQCPGVTPWMSDEIHPGKKWCVELISSLKKSKFAIICITRDNIYSPWLAFEAGAIAAKFRDARVVPYLCDVRPRDLGTSPLANWQAVACTDKEANQVLFNGMVDIGENGKEHDLAAKQQHFTRYWELLEEQYERFGVGEDKRNAPSAAITEAIRELHTISGQLARTHYTSTFPTFIATQITPCIRRAKHRVRVACDFPAYGSFSDHEAYDEYSKVISDHRRSGLEVKMVVPDADHRDNLVHRQFGNSDQVFQDARSNNSAFAELLRKFELRSGKPIPDLAEFVKSAMGLQDLLLDDLCKKSAGEVAVEIRETEFILSMHMWIIDEDEGFFSLPMLSPDAQEHGIHTEDRGLVRALIGLWENYWDSGKPTHFE